MRRRPRRRGGTPAAVAAACVAAVWCASAGGCGYRLGGFRKPPRVRTVAVPIFDNATFPLRRDVEYDLTAAVRRELQARTSLRLVAREDADLVLHGRIVDFRERVIAEGRRDEKVESTLTLRATLVIEDYVNRTQRYEEVTDSEPFSIARGETLDSARRRAIGNLAEKIVLILEDW